MREVFRRNAKGTESPTIDLMITGEVANKIGPGYKDKKVISHMIRNNEGSILLIGNGYFQSLTENCFYEDIQRYRAIWLHGDGSLFSNSKDPIIFRNYAQKPEEKEHIHTMHTVLYVHSIQSLWEELLREYEIEALA